jgi:hypothetical protein
VQNLYSPPASRCFSPTRGSRTNPSGASPAKQNAWIPQARCRISNEPKRRRPVHSVGRKPQFPSSPHRAVPSTAANAFSSGGRWVRQPDPPLAAVFAAVQGKRSTAGPGLFRARTKRKAVPRRSLSRVGTRGRGLLTERSRLREACFLSALLPGNKPFGRFLHGFQNGTNPAVR